MEPLTDKTALIIYIIIIHHHHYHLSSSSSSPVPLRQLPGVGVGDPGAAVPLYHIFILFSHIICAVPVVSGAPSVAPLVEHLQINAYCQGPAQSPKSKRERG